MSDTVIVAVLSVTGNGVDFIVDVSDTGSTSGTGFVTYMVTRLTAGGTITINKA